MIIIPESEISYENKEALSLAKGNVAFATTMLSYMMFNRDFVWTRDVPLAAAGPLNGKNMIYVNPDNWLTAFDNTKMRAWVLLHEAMHIFLEHSGRQIDFGYNHQLWNIATDHNINLFITGAYAQQGSSNVEYNSRFQQFLEKPDFVLYDEKYINMSSDEIYHAILEENGGDMQKALEQYGMGMPPEMEGDGSGEGQGDGLGKPGKGKKGRVLDEVSSEKPTTGQQISNRQAASAGAAAAQFGNNSMGEHEMGMARIFASMMKPKLDWKEQLADIVMTSTRERPTYNRLSRRMGQGGVVFPSMTGNKVNLVFGVDTSGSMSNEELNEAASELSAIMSQFEAWDVELITCDTRAHSMGNYSSEEGHDFAGVNMNWIGGGGTAMHPLAEYAQERIDEGVEVNAFILVTDGYIPEQELEDALSPDCQNIVLVTCTGAETVNLPSAKVIYMRDVG